MTERERDQLTTRDIAAATQAPAPENVRPPAPERVPPPQTDDNKDLERHSLFPPEEANGFRARWEGIQTGFVDQPRAAVEEADALVAQLMKRLAEMFAEERRTLEQQWDRGDRISTEDLRVALTRYRAFFHRLLSM